MTESLLAFVLTQLDQVGSPIYLHRELERFPSEDLKALLSSGILRETSRAERFGDLIVRETARGLFGVADEDDFFDPVPLTDDDVRQYEVSLPKLVARLRHDNGIDGTGSAGHNGLFPLGQRAIEGIGTVDVYLSLPNENEALFLSRCQRLERPVGSQKVVLLTPRGVSVSPEGRRILDSTGVIMISLMAAAANGTLALDWDRVIVLPEILPATEYPKDKRIFKKQGQTWLCVYVGIPKSIPDSVGMAYICHLLRNAGPEMHAAALRSAIAGEENPPILGSAGEVLDEQALREYKHRISEIDDELAEAEANNDFARKDSLHEEREFIYAEVGRATGLHGRNREASSDRERARQAVSTAIHRALRAIKKEHEPLWQHLHNALKIGEFLSYHPDQPTAWTT